MRKEGKKRGKKRRSNRNIVERRRVDFERRKRKSRREKKGKKESMREKKEREKSTNDTKERGMHRVERRRSITLVPETIPRGIFTTMRGRKVVQATTGRCMTEGITTEGTHRMSHRHSRQNQAKL
ncbi:hypothetical protein BLNAU_19190 [Blattamonas nauphoetae]|uniref:Uncharacterized protein n=1 Tax=Blattamonas nauphoetae TaxID=2049346 RepID=A0ABQ9X3H0_9EUKA|nr:hypothetical protein BLNAU_19190 [Blattamonas nauphoetae]